ncbi:hypothetical protein DFR70_13321 [Nocardia tenerifensis]|uniref:Uncharacterized protein n=1 Tax=Nocardia tenerifensis TaxID=228006 RepID=A0A318JRF1_9NOCA|nr:hypothetical protein [Nocardia tenerifensis]PXX52289.1 hypothetical protein DFR70_13321 [Nocardia tenerifensis]
MTEPAPRIERFIVARLAEDERDAGRERYVAALRTAVLSVLEYEGELTHLIGERSDAERSRLERIPTLRAIAGIWRDHPDFDPDWVLSEPRF